MRAPLPPPCWMLPIKERHSQPLHPILAAWKTPAREMEDEVTPDMARKSSLRAPANHFDCGEVVSNPPALSTSYFSSPFNNPKPVGQLIEIIFPPQDLLPLWKKTKPKQKPKQKPTLGSLHLPHLHQPGNIPLS